MATLHDEEWRALVDLNVPRSDVPEFGTWVPAGEVIPVELRDRVKAMEQPTRRSKGK
jgi:hypothetical protein